jgi:L-fucose isomerase
VPAPTFLSGFGANHVHAVPGDVRAELRAAAELMGVRVEEWSRGE